jgi:hypothetical protein
LELNCNTVRLKINICKKLCILKSLCVKEMHNLVLGKFDTSLFFIYFIGTIIAIEL